MVNLESISKIRQIDSINNTLLIILLILVIFCICFYIYNGFNMKNIGKNIVNYDNFYNTIDNKIVLLELMEKAKDNAQSTISKMDTIINAKMNEKMSAANNTKEKFLVDDRLLLENDAINYYNSITAVQSWLDNSYNGPYGILAQISSDMQTASNIRQQDKKAILDLLTNIYIVAYINSNNRKNAEAYKVYSKYSNPKNNKYYSQYMK